MKRVMSGIKSESRPFKVFLSEKNVLEGFALSIAKIRQPGNRYVLKKD